APWPRRLTELHVFGPESTRAAQGGIVAPLVRTDDFAIRNRSRFMRGRTSHKRFAGLGIALFLLAGTGIGVALVLFAGLAGRTRIKSARRHTTDTPGAAAEKRAEDRVRGTDPADPGALECRLSQWRKAARRFPGC